MFTIDDLEWFLTKKDLADIFDISYRTVERYLVKGTFPSPDLYIGKMPRWGITLFNSFMAISSELRNSKIIQVPKYRGKKLRRGTFELVSRN